MPCDTRLKTYADGRKQTLTQRVAEVRNVIARVNALLAAGKAKAVIAKSGPERGAITFQGIDDIRDGVTDACVYRWIMKTGSAQAKLAIARAEQMAGTSVNRATVAQGHHSHDGGHTWHHGH